MRLIDADELLNKIKEGIQEDGNFETDAEHIIDFIELFTNNFEIKISQSVE